VIGSLSWVARQARPDLLYRVSKLQQEVKGATIATLKSANKCVDIAKDDINVSLRFASGAFPVSEWAVLTVTDASFGNEEGNKSQGARCHFLIPASQAKDPQCCTYTVRPIAFASNTIKRVCRATLQAETYALQAGMEAGDKLRGLIAEMKGDLKSLHNWYEVSRKTVPHLILSDCRSLTQHVNAEVPARCSDKRLQIEMSSIRQSLYDEGDRTWDKWPEGGDCVEWVATATMIADCLTKPMKSDFLRRVLSECEYTVEKQQK
jgi:hypothetical protein